MAVVPRSPILSDSVAIREGVAGCNGTLGDSIDAIVLKRIEHAHAVPVDCSSVPL